MKVLALGSSIEMSRLVSVIIPAHTPPHLGVPLPASVDMPLQARVERLIQSLLEQPGADRCEAVVVANEAVADHLRNVFGGEIATKRLLIVRPKNPRIMGVAEALNAGAAVASGWALTFLDPRDHWLPGRLSQIEENLKRNELIVSSREHSGQSFDWLGTFLRQNWLMPSSIAVRRIFFDQLGGFSEKWGIHAEYEFCLRSLVLLSKSGQMRRFEIVPGVWIDSDRGTRSELPPLELLKWADRSFGKLREWGTLLRSVRQIPPRYWPNLLGKAGQGAQDLRKRLLPKKDPKKGM